MFVDGKKKPALLKQLEPRIEDILHVGATAKYGVGNPRVFYQPFDLILRLQNTYGRWLVGMQHGRVDEVSKPRRFRTFQYLLRNRYFPRGIVAHTHRRHEKCRICIRQHLRDTDWI